MSRNKIFNSTLVFLFGCLILHSSAEAQSWDHIRYYDLSKKGQLRWNSQLEITGDTITFIPHGGPHVIIPKKDIVELRYGKAAAYKEIPSICGLMEAYTVGLPIVVPLQIFSLFHHPAQHQIGIIFSDSHAINRVRRLSGISFQADARNYREILAALQEGATASLLVTEHDHARIPAKIPTTTAAQKNTYMDVYPPWNLMQAFYGRNMVRSPAP